MTTILVTYASQHGATAEIAQTIARVMKTFNLDVTAKRVEYVKDIADYDVIILGTAIYLGDWLEKAVDFLETYQVTLADKIVWLFASGPTGDGDALELLGGVLVPETMRDLVDAIAPQEIKLFKGKIDLRRLPPDERKIVKAANVPRGDYRDWEAIEEWARVISQALSVTAIIKKPQTDLLIVQD